MKTYKWRSPTTGGVKYGVDYVDPAGRRVRRVVATTRKAAEAILAKIRVELETGEYYDRRDKEEVALGELITRYKEYFRSKDSYETECHHLAVIENHFGKDRIISRITLADAEEFRQGRVDAPHRLRGEKNPFRKRALSTVNREVQCLRRLLYKAIDWKLLKENPVGASLLFDEPKGKISYLTAAQAGALLEAAQEEARSNRRCKRNLHLYTILLTALETGMRLGNVLNLRWNEIDFSKRTIHLHDTKPGTSLNVPMSSRLADALSRGPRRLWSEYVFATSNGQAYKRIEKSFDRAKRKAGIPSSFRFHDLRHTFVSHALAQGVPIHVVARIVGHSTTRMTERYAHLIEGQEHDAVERLPEWKSAMKEGGNAG